MQCDCLAVVLACLMGFRAVADLMALQRTITWRSVNSFVVECAGAPVVWTPAFPSCAPLSAAPPADVQISWSGAVTVAAEAPVPVPARDEAAQTYLRAAAMWVALSPDSRRADIFGAQRASLWPAPFSWGLVAVASAFAAVGAPSVSACTTIPFGSSGPWFLSLAVPERFAVRLTCVPPPPGWSGVWFKLDTSVDSSVADWVHITVDSGAAITFPATVSAPLGRASPPCCVTAGTARLQ